jgi:hypothetical protein
MNTTGKEWMTKLIASNIKQNLRKQKRPSITLKWKDDQVDFSSEEVISGIQSDSASEMKGILMLNIQSYSASALKGVAIRTSRRQRKIPVTRHEDFLRTVGSSKIIY